jgi:hypothetical protein
MREAVSLSVSFNIHATLEESRAFRKKIQREEERERESHRRERMKQEQHARAAQT